MISSVLLIWCRSNPDTRALDLQERYEDVSVIRVTAGKRHGGGVHCVMFGYTSLVLQSQETLLLHPSTRSKWISMDP